MIKFIKSNSIKIELLKKQKKLISDVNKIKKVLKENDVIAFDIFNDNNLIGFVMLKEFKKHSFFLWDYAIDYKYQNKGYGYKALLELIELLKEKYNIELLTTTYTYGNNVAKKLYEKIGFIETDIVNDEKCHEVNMIFKIKNEQ